MLAEELLFLLNIDWVVLSNSAQTLTIAIYIMCSFND